MRRFRLLILAPFTRHYKRLDRHEQVEAQRILELLEIDPYIDNVAKYTVEAPDGRITYYDGPYVWVSYRMTDSDEVTVMACGPHRPRIPSPGRLL